MVSLRSPFVAFAVTLIAGAASAQLTIERDTHTHVAQSPLMHVTARSEQISPYLSHFWRITMSADRVPLEIPAGMALVVTDVRCRLIRDDEFVELVGPSELVQLSARLPSEEVAALLDLRVPIGAAGEGIASAELTSGFVVPAQATLEATTLWAGPPSIELYGYLVPTGPVRIPLPELTLPRPGVPPGGPPPGEPPPTTEPPF